MKEQMYLMPDPPEGGEPTVPPPGTPTKPPPDDDGN